jgi:hypothetical protein
LYIGDKDCTGKRIEPTEKRVIKWSTSKSIFDDAYALTDEDKEGKFRSTTLAKKGGKK